MSHRIARRMCWFAAATVSVLFAAAHLTEAGEITYAIQNYPADQQGATLSGAITTDGVIGTLATTDIVSWSWTITPPGGTPFTLSSSDVEAFPAFIEGSIVASQSTITMPAPAQGSLNEFRLFGVDPTTGESDLDYQRNFLNGPPLLNGYEADIAPHTIWNTSNPTMGGTDPWVIAAVASVPEPTSLILMGLGATYGIAFGLARKRRSRAATERATDR